MRVNCSVEKPWDCFLGPTALSDSGLERLKNGKIISTTAFLCHADPILLLALRRGARFRAMSLFMSCDAIFVPLYKTKAQLS